MCQISHILLDKDFGNFHFCIICSLDKKKRSEIALIQVCLKLVRGIDIEI